MTTADVRFQELYASYFKPVHAYCHRRTEPDRVDDATSEVFLVAWRKIDQVPAGSDALPWLYQVAYGVLTNVWRGAGRQTRLRQKLDAYGVGTAPPADEFVVMRHEARQILEAMAQLKASQQEVLRLSVWEGLSGSELAVALDVTVDAAKQRLSRARRELVEAYNLLETGKKSSLVARKGGAW